MTTTVYSQSGTVQLSPFSKHKIVVVTGVLATIVGAMGLADYFTAWLNILGVALPPVAGVIICDYYFLKGMKYEYGAGTVYCKVNAWAFISMIGGMVIGFYRTLGHCFH